MNPLQTLQLLTYANQLDPRVEVTAEITDIWHDMLGDLDVTRCREAVRRHYRTSTERLMPAHVRQLAKSTTGPIASDGWCPNCKCVHEPHEPCTVLERRPEVLAQARKAFRALPSGVQW